MLGQTTELELSQEGVVLRGTLDLVELLVNGVGVIVDHVIRSDFDSIVVAGQEVHTANCELETFVGGKGIPVLVEHLEQFVVVALPLSEDVGADVADEVDIVNLEGRSDVQVAAIRDGVGGGHVEDVIALVNHSDVCVALIKLGGTGGNLVYVLLAEDVLSGVHE